MKLVALATNLNIENLIPQFISMAFGNETDTKVKIYRHRINNKYPFASQVLIDKIRSAGFEVSITENINTILPSDKITDAFILSDEYTPPRGLYYDIMGLPLASDKIRFYRIVDTNDKGR